METGNSGALNNNKKFKSYYVVWKHSPKGIKDFCASSLNRTMQYGNPGSSEEDSKEAYV